MNITEMLRACLDWSSEQEAKGVEQVAFSLSAFEDMQAKAERGVKFSRKQESWIRGVYERLFDEPEYENAWSAGKVPRGREVPTPAVLMNLPLKPPKRPVP